MSEKKKENSIRRILVALDASAQSLAALDVAANVAALLDAEIVGIFVEDVNLLRVAQLPFVNEVRFPMADVREIDVDHMEEYWQTQATEVRRQLGELAGKRAVNWSFQRVRGGVTSQLLRAAGQADLLAMGRLGRSLFRNVTIGSSARQTLIEGQGPLLLTRSGVDLGEPILMIYDGSESSIRALNIAAILAQISGHLRILIWTDDQQLAQKFKSDIVESLNDQKLEISYRRFYPAHAEKLIQDLKQSDFGLLVVGLTGSRLSPELELLLLEKYNFPLLIIR